MQVEIGGAYFGGVTLWVFDGGDNRSLPSSGKAAWLTGERCGFQALQVGEGGDGALGFTGDRAHQVVARGGLSGRRGSC